MSDEEDQETAKTITLDEALLDVEIRFLYNLPESELSQIDRLLLWIEEANWFYDDFYADNYPNLPRFTFKSFTKAIFQHCELFRGMENNVDEIFKQYRQYRSKIPRCGCIILTPDMTQVLLVCDWHGNSWTFPRGKLNENEEPIDCAIREVYEETGFDCSPYVNRDELYVLEADEGMIKLFIVPNVPADSEFQSLTRKEISDISFFHLNSIPENSFGVKHFLRPLKVWISKRRQRHNSFDASQVKLSKKSSKADFKTFNSRNPDTFEGESKANWSVDAMFAANSFLTGKNYDYDGNPQAFGGFHPRYVNYNSLEEGSNSATPKRIHTSEDLGLDDVVQKSSQFHQLRKIGAEASMATAVTTTISTDLKKAKARSTSTTKIPHLATATSSKTVIATAATSKTKSHSSTRESEELIQKVVNLSGFFPVPFKIDRELAMKAFDDGWKRSS